MKRGKAFIGICVGVIIVLLVIVFYFVVNSNANLDVGDIDVGDIDVGDKNPMRGKSNKRRQSQSITKNYSFDNISDFSSFVVSHNVGEVIVGYNEGENIEVEATCFVEFCNQDDVDKIEENVDVIITTKDNECLVAAVSKDDNTDLWDWVSENVENVNFSISLAISLPRSNLQC
jgi:hypothetical protein